MRTHATRSLWWLAVVASLAVALTGCTTARNLLGTPISRCFRVLPTARLAVDLSKRSAAAKLVGVQWIGASAIVAAGEHDSAGTEVEMPPLVLLEKQHKRNVCAVAFSGKFAPSAVAKPWTPQAGPYKVAVVVVRQSDNHLLATVLLRRLPPGLHFSHRFGL